MISLKKETPFSRLDVDDQVRRAAAAARQIVLLGLDDVAGRETSNEFLNIRVESLVGHDGPRVELKNKDVERFDDYLSGAYALGIAIGLLLRADAFSKGTR